MRWGDNQVPRARRHPLWTTTHSLLNDLTEVTWRPFHDLVFLDLERLALVKNLSEHRVLFRGIWGHAWYLGERLVPQWSNIEPCPSPGLPPPTMHCPEIILADEMELFANGVWYDSFLDQDRDYRAFLEEKTVCTPLGLDGPVGRVRCVDLFGLIPVLPILHKQDPLPVPEGLSGLLTSPFVASLPGPIPTQPTPVSLIFWIRT
ncbi:uncharacterized protein LOC122070276 [Macadamia integrifolia]|uniref:uncharacterized protein LOC122070276 n=1 Tax=Macadamia integrifolia TaxID=60698 RepID=UPI001C4EC5F8|nr:uncharacterized protein LOC122070276 [Macadamia integrifolia]